ncbi:hypothetical protein [Kitasatospora arboriphila]|uniref:Uncharacterized protein n=1 Tax=Kitasatospora arboriphila TaxID=258052 RepID=A0ABN1TVD6_9ACTN
MSVNDPFARLPGAVNFTVTVTVTVTAAAAGATAPAGATLRSG